jgi:hypothetical protein
MAINARIQGTAADIQKKAMIAVDAAPCAPSIPDARALLSVHDELVIEAPAAQARASRRWSSARWRASRRSRRRSSWRPAGERTGCEAQRLDLKRSALRAVAIKGRRRSSTGLARPRGSGSGAPGRCAPCAPSAAAAPAVHAAGAWISTGSAAIRRGASVVMCFSTESASRRARSRAAPRRCPWW